MTCSMKYLFLFVCFSGLNNHQINFANSLVVSDLMGTLIPMYLEQLAVIDFLLQLIAEPSIQDET